MKEDQTVSETFHLCVMRMITTKKPFYLFLSACPGTEDGNLIPATHGKYKSLTAKCIVVNLNELSSLVCFFFNQVFLERNV